MHREYKGGEVHGPYSTLNTKQSMVSTWLTTGARGVPSFRGVSLGRWMARSMRESSQWSPLLPGAPLPGGLAVSN